MSKSVHDLMEIGNKLAPVTDDLARVVQVLRQGGVIAYPTEGVWGLGCHPFLSSAVVERLLTIKRRSVGKGLILLLADWAMLDNLTDNPELVRTKIAERECMMKITGPATWLIPPSINVPSYLTGEHDRVAVRLVRHPLIKRLIACLGCPLISTSANLSGEQAVTEREQLSLGILRQIDLVLQGQVGGLRKPTPIYDLMSGTQLRS